MENKTNNTTKKPIYEALVFNGALSITNVFDAMKFCSLEDLQSYVENHKERTILKVELNGRDKNLVIWLSHNDIAHETPMGTKLGMVYLEESENKYAAFIGSDDSILCPIEVVLDMLIEEGAEIWLNDNLNEINYIFPGEDEETTLAPNNDGLYEVGDWMNLMVCEDHLSRDTRHMTMRELWEYYLKKVGENNDGLTSQLNNLLVGITTMLPFKNNDEQERWESMLDTYKGEKEFDDLTEEIISRTEKTRIIPSNYGDFWYKGKSYSIAILTTPTPYERSFDVSALMHNFINAANLPDFVDMEMVWYSYGDYDIDEYARLFNGTEHLWKEGE